MLVGTGVLDGPKKQTAAPRHRPTSMIVINIQPVGRGLARNPQNSLCSFRGTPRAPACFLVLTILCGYAKMRKNNVSNGGRIYVGKGNEKYNHTQVA